MEKVLIGVIGKGQYDRETGRNDYRLTKYRLDDGTMKESKLVLDILKEQLKPEKIYIVGTKESLWNVADEYIGDYEKVYIPYGKSPEEFWKIFEVLTELDIQDKEIHFDITHGFRSIPLFVSTLLNFFTKVKGASIGGVYYGIFEAKNDDGSTPVVNMFPFLEMSRFVDAFYLFQKFSDGREIAGIIQEKLKEIPVEQKKKFSKLQSLAKELEFYSKSVGFSALRFYQNSLQKIEGIIEEIDKVPDSLRATGFLMKDMTEESGRLKGIKLHWQKDMMTAKLFFERNRYAQSLTILRETALTYILETLGLDVDDKDLREDSLSAIFKSESDNLEHKKDLRYFTKEWLKLFKKIRELRNKANHAFIQRSVGEKDIKKSVDNLRDFLVETERLMNEDRIILDKNSLKSALRGEL